MMTQSLKFIDAFGYNLQIGDEVWVLTRNKHKPNYLRPAIIKDILVKSAFFVEVYLTTIWKEKFSNTHVVRRGHMTRRVRLTNEIIQGEMIVPIPVVKHKLPPAGEMWLKFANIKISEHI